MALLETQNPEFGKLQAIKRNAKQLNLNFDEYLISGKPYDIWRSEKLQQRKSKVKRWSLIIIIFNGITITKSIESKWIKYGWSIRTCKYYE